MKKMQLVICSFALLLSVSSCSHRLTDFTVISTKNIPLGKNAASLQKANQRVKGVDRSHVVLCIPLGSPNMKEAIDKAIEKYPGAVGLADGVVKSKGWTAVLYGQNSFVVEGTPIYEADAEKMDLSVPSVNTQTSEAMLFFHEVKVGETLSGIATSYNVKVGDIVKWNQLSSNEITPGTKLKIIMK